MGVRSELGKFQMGGSDLIGQVRGRSWQTAAGTDWARLRSLAGPGNWYPSNLLSWNAKSSYKRHREGPAQRRRRGGRGEKQWGTAYREETQSGATSTTFWPTPKVGGETARSLHLRLLPGLVGEGQEPSWHKGGSGEAPISCLILCGKAMLCLAQIPLHFYGCT